MRSARSARSAPPSARPAEAGRWRLGLLLALTFGTGVVDAVSFLHLGEVFAGNMTGNVVILGVAGTGATDLSVAGPAAALAGFALGAAGGGRALRSAGGAAGSAGSAGAAGAAESAASAGWRGRHTALVCAVGLVVAGAAVVLAVAAEPLAAGVELPVTAALAGAMGVQAAVARQLAVRDVTTVVVTSTLTALAADSRAEQGGGAHARRVGALVALTAGAAAGAALLRLGAGWALLAAAAVALGTAVAGGLRRF